MPTATASATPQELISSLVEISTLDTLYRDLFFEKGARINVLSAIPGWLSECKSECGLTRNA